MEEFDTQEEFDRLLNEFSEANSDRRASLLMKCGAILTPRILVDLPRFPEALLRIWKQSLADSDADVRRAAVFSVYFCTPASAKVLVDDLRAVAGNPESDLECREQILVILARLGNPEGINFVFQQLIHADSAIRERAVRELGDIDYQYIACHKEIRDALQDSSDVVRVSAAEILWNGEQDAESVFPVLWSFLNDRSSAQRLDAARLLCKMKASARKAFPTLLELRNEQHWTLRLQAVRAIKMIGPCDSTALSVLNEMIHDEHGVVAESAMRVLQDVEKE